MCRSLDILTQEIIKNGHQVHYFTGSKFEANFNFDGLHFHPTDFTILENQIAKSPSNLVGLLPVFVQTWQNFLDKYLQTIREINPNLIIYDNMCFFWSRRGLSSKKNQV